MTYWGRRKDRRGCKYEKGPLKGSTVPTKQLRCIPSIREGGQGFRVNLRHVVHMTGAFMSLLFVVQVH